MKQTRKGNAVALWDESAYRRRYALWAGPHRRGTAPMWPTWRRPHALLHGEEKEGFADAGYQGVEKREGDRV